MTKDYEVIQDKVDELRSDISIAHLHRKKVKESLILARNITDILDNPILPKIINLAKMHSLGFQVKQDNELAFFFTTLAASLGDIESKHALGLLYLNGKGVKKDIHRGLAILSEAAESGSVTALLGLGNHYLSNEPEKAIGYLLLAAEKNDMDAKAAVAKFIQETPEYCNDPFLFISALQSLADRGDALCQFILGYLYLAEKIISTPHSNFEGTLNLEKALDYLTLATSQEVSDARYYLGLMHYYGYGTPKNTRLAKYYFSAGIAEGHAPSELFIQKM